jgi:hypothetical protein
LRLITSTPYLPHNSGSSGNKLMGSLPNRYSKDKIMSAQDKQHNSNQANCTAKEVVTSRKVIGAWVMGGGIWLLGMLALLVVPMISTDVNARVTPAPTHYSHSGSWKTVTDPSGKYTAVVRDIVQAPKF